MPEKKTKATEPVPVEPAVEVTPQPIVPTQPATITTAQPDTGLAIVSLILGILSLAGFGLFLGIPAVITGAIAIKKKHGSHGMSLAGIITGAVGTVLSLLFFVFWVILMIWIAGQPNTTPYKTYPVGPGGIERINSLNRT